jgi:hypothetical protein
MLAKPWRTHLSSTCTRHDRYAYTTAALNGENSFTGQVGLLVRSDLHIIHIYIYIYIFENMATEPHAQDISAGPTSSKGAAAGSLPPVCRIFESEDVTLKIDHLLKFHPRTFPCDPHPLYPKQKSLFLEFPGYTYSRASLIRSCGHQPIKSPHRIQRPLFAVSRVSNLRPFALCWRT